MGLKMPWLIQRCLLDDSDSLKFDYMGSSEFEFGTVPNALSWMAEENLTIHAFEDEILGTKIEYFLFGSTDRDWQNYRQIFLGLVDDSIRTLEPTGLKDELEVLLNIRKRKQHHHRTNVWIDLENGCMFAISKDIIDRLDSLWRASIKGEGKFLNAGFGGYLLTRST